MATYFETKAVLDEISMKTLLEKRRMDQAKAMIAEATANLVAMPSQYSGVGSQIDTDAAANPESELWQLAKAEKDVLVTEFVALRNTAQALNTAVGN